MDDETKEKLLDTVVWLVLWIPMCLWTGYVGFKLYHWHVQAAFTSLPEVTYWHCVGINAFAAWWYMGLVPERTASGTARMFAGFIANALLLLLGWMVA